MKKIKISEALMFGWNRTIKNFWLITNAILLTALVYFAVDIFSTNVSSWDAGAAVIGFGGGILATNFMTFVLMKFFLNIYDNKEVTVLGMLKNSKGFYKFFIVYMAVNLATIAGLFFLIIPAIYVVVTYSFALYLLIDRNLGIQESLTESARISRGHKIELLKFWLALVCINIVGSALFLVGLLFSLPVSFLAIIYVYRELLNTETAPTI
jgi:uncharacterized membrane protein